MIPGSNLLQQALTVIKPTAVDYYRYSGRATNAIGLDVATYDAAVRLSKASVQPVDRAAFKQMGLDYNKRYIEIFVLGADIEDLGRARAPDQFGYNGRRFEVIGETDWNEIDGWDRVLAVELGPDE